MMVRNKVLTLVFIRDGAHILLGLKKRGFGMGRWNGFGGKVEHGETILQAAKRELREESHLVAGALTKAGLLMFEFAGSPQLLEVHVFKSHDYEGQPAETEEMKPQWYHTDNLPYDKMWPDDRYWLPLMLKDACFYGYFKFEGHDLITDYTLKEVSKVEDIKIPEGPL